MKKSHYDVAIIGAGMSGLAAGIRLAHFGQKVCIFERHNTPGGLNSFYSIAGRKFDVGLHAITNYVPPGVKATPLGKLLRQLRIDRDELALCPQKQSRIAFGPRGEITLRFTNNFTVLDAEVAAKFPHQADGWRALVQLIRAYNDVSLAAKPISAREIIARYLTDPLLTNMIFCPVMYYGSAQERDMEFRQFVTMFKAIFLEGFARPLEGVRVIIRVLLERFRQTGGERWMKCGVARIEEEKGKVAALELDNGDAITVGHVISSIGFPETLLLCDAAHKEEAAANTSALSFAETIAVYREPPANWGWGDDTIVFFNDSERFSYEHTRKPVDTRSGVICFPNNFDYAEDKLGEGLMRVTSLASYNAWANQPNDRYQEAKRLWFERMQQSARRFLQPVANEILPANQVTTDMFTPRTIKKFTGHLNGAIYGAPRKVRDGRTHLKNLYICGTDQGLFGIIGAMFSGISIANLHVLQAEKARRT